MLIIISGMGIFKGPPQANPTFSLELKLTKGYVYF